MLGPTLGDRAWLTPKKYMCYLPKFVRFRSDDTDVITKIRWENLTP